MVAWNLVKMKWELQMMTRIIKIWKICFLPATEKRERDDETTQLLVVTVVILFSAGPGESWLRSPECPPSPFLVFHQLLRTCEALECARWNLEQPAWTGPSGRPLPGPASAAPSGPRHFIGFLLHLQHGLLHLLIIITLPETPACLSSRFISPHSLGDTILSTESAVAAVASLSPWLTPASPVLVPVRDFKFKLNFNAAALMFEVELPSQEVAGDGDSVVSLPLPVRNSEPNVSGKHLFSSRD